MRWRGRRESGNVEDRRGGGGMHFPGRVGMPGGMRGGGRIGGVGLIIVIGLMLLFGVDPRVLLENEFGGQLPDIRLPEHPRTQRVPAPGGEAAQAPRNGGADELGRFVSVVLADTEDVWNDLFSKAGRTYREPTLVLFTGGTRSACGMGVSQMGPFYCPLDQKVYIDLGFYRELREKFRAPGDFAQAYVIAHEVGHHVQTLLGITEKVQNAKARMSQRDANAVQVRMELQADCLAGVWAHHAHRMHEILEPGDIDEALNAASAIGDDTIQKRTQGRVVPDAFTHGTAAQRRTWFKRGFDSGATQDCDTFSARSL